MSKAWYDRTARLGLSNNAADLAARRFGEVEAAFATRVGDPAAARAWWIPGRIEVLGKHTDYGGGRSLLCTVERGFHVLARPRPDSQVRILDASSSASLTTSISVNIPPRPGHWSDYPLTVIRRMARDFPQARTGVDLVLRSSLPSASGLSSSSALVIACFLPLAECNALQETSAWRDALPDNDALGGYLGAVENGRGFGPFAADRGVGTHGGSEDQTAILSCQPGRLSQYHFLPVTPESLVPLPPGWVFAIGASGVHAAKGGGAQARYNDLAREVALLLAAWNRSSSRDDGSLFAALRSAPDAAARIEQAVQGNRETANLLLARLAQFRAETEELIPAVVACLVSGDMEGIGPLVDRSQSLAESTLRNQVPETMHLVRTARTAGAAAASAFGAGFGGSVWALIREEAAGAFLASWRDNYSAAFSKAAAHAEFFLTHPGPSAGRVPAAVP